MNRQAAAHIISNTFTHPFDENQFTIFIRNLLNEIDESKYFDYYGNYIPDAFKGYIKRYKRLGTYTDPKGNKIDILIVHLARGQSLWRARTTQRNFIAWHLKKRGKDAALVAFIYADNPEDWRFSLVKMDYCFEKGESGKIKVKEEFTPARRWSFLVGKNEKNHTAQSRLIPILENDNNPTLKDLEEAFNIEPVTKEFFVKYRDLLIRTVDALDVIVEKDKIIRKNFKSKNVTTVDFAKKLLGQIVFLYFLQKKGWFGVKKDKRWGTGPKDFLRRLFNKEYGDYKNFFNDILEPMFYEALARERDNNFYSKFNCKIPFLNGGLFEPIGGYDWVQTDILLPDELFSNRHKTPEGDIGDGILDILDRFNFTVREDEPLEKEVAIDPELLGKLYEKFNAIRFDNFYEYKKALASGKRSLEKQFNKKFGVYYTPREIVHYMCQQSLINYLYTELEDKISKGDIEKLIKFGEQFTENEIVVEKKGKETKTYKYQLPETIRKNAKLIDDKLKDIKVCDPAVGSGAFLVGMMNEIIKTRRSLNPFIKEGNRNIYTFKRECIENSLYGVDIDSGACEVAKLRLWLSLIVDEENIENIKPLPNLDYKIVQGNSLLGIGKNLFNNQLFNQLEKTKQLYFRETNPAKKQEYKNQIEKLIYNITNGYKEFDFKIYFSEVFHQKGGFDVVIGNPPYGIVYNKIFKQQLLKNYLSFKRNNDIYIAFYECGLGLLKNKGILTYISPNTFLIGEYFKNFRKHLTTKTIIKEIFDFKELHIFEDPTVFVCIICCQNQRDIKFPYKYKLKVAKNSLKSFSVQDIIVNGPTLNSIGLKNNLYLKLINDKTINLAEHLFYIKDVGFNYWTKGRGKKRGKDSIGKRVFYSGKPKNKKDIPFLKGRDVFRYHIKKPTNFLIHNYHQFLDPKIDILRFTPSFLELKPKIVYRQTANKIIAAIDTNGYFLDKTVHLIVPKDGSPYFNMKYILALLNSTLLNYLYIHIAQERKGRTFAQVKITYVKKLPIKICSLAKQKQLIDIVDKILSLTQSEDYLNNPQKQAIVKNYEYQIDQLVYNIYGLTEEEIAIVEKKFLER